MDVRTTARNYMVWAICLPVVLYLLCIPLGKEQFGFIAALFHIVCSMAYVMGWQAISLRSPETLPKYFLAASALRLMAAAIVLLVFCVVNRTDIEAIKWFAIVFIIFYLVILAFDAVFFAKVSNNKKVTK